MSSEDFEDKTYSLPPELLLTAEEDSTTPEELRLNSLNKAFELAENIEAGK